MKEQELIIEIEKIIKGFVDDDGNIKHWKVKNIAERIVKNCNLQNVIGRSEQFYCPCCGSDKTYKTEAYHCNRCAVTTEV